MCPVAARGRRDKGELASWGAAAAAAPLAGSHKGASFSSAVKGGCCDGDVLPPKNLSDFGKIAEVERWVLFVAYYVTEVIKQ